MLNNLERELDLVHDLYLGLEINEEDLTLSSTSRHASVPGEEYLQQQAKAFERSNLKSVISSFNIHLKEVATLSSQIRNDHELSSRTLDIMKQRLQAALSCIDNLQLMAELKNRKNESKIVPVGKKPLEEQLNRVESIPVAEDPSIEQQSALDNGFNADNDDVFLGDTRLDMDVLSNEALTKEASGRKDLLNKMDEELMSREQLLLSHKRILCELNTVMTHRVKEQKDKENELIQRKYGSDAVVKMGWDATIAPLKSLYSVFQISAHMAYSAGLLSVGTFKLIKSKLLQWLEFFIVYSSTMKSDLMYSQKKTGVHSSASKCCITGFCFFPVDSQLAFVPRF